jgi:hypothetical protein
MRATCRNAASLRFSLASQLLQKAGAHLTL